MLLLHTRRQTHTHSHLATYTITNSYIVIDPHTQRNTISNTLRHKYQTYHTNTHTYKRSYFPRTTRDWNTLPQHILDCKTIDSFTKQIHTHTCHHNTLTLTNTIDSLPPYLPNRCPTHPRTTNIHVRTLYATELVPYALFTRIRKVDRRTDTNNRLSVHTYIHTHIDRNTADFFFFYLLPIAPVGFK